MVSSQKASKIISTVSKQLTSARKGGSLLMVAVNLLMYALAEGVHFTPYTPDPVPIYVNLPHPNNGKYKYDVSYTSL
jgi:hypothetical protein